MNRTDEQLHNRPFVEGLPDEVRELLRSQEGLDELTRTYLSIRGKREVGSRGAELFRFWRHCHLHLVEEGQGREPSDEFNVCKEQIEQYLRQQIA